MPNAFSIGEAVYRSLIELEAKRRVDDLLEQLRRRRAQRSRVPA